MADNIGVMQQVHTGNPLDQNHPRQLHFIGFPVRIAGNPLALREVGCEAWIIIYCQLAASYTAGLY